MTSPKVAEVDGGALTITAGDVELCRYVVTPDVPQLESPHPYLHPIRTLQGSLVSLYRPHDHVWHKGISLALPHVGDANFWGGPTFVRGRGYQQLPNNGTQQHEAFESVKVEGDVVAIVERLRWTTEQGESWFTEARRQSVRILADGAGWVLTFETAMTNGSGSAVEFGSPTTAGRPNAGYGGLFWRGPRSFNNGTILSSDGPGGPDMMGERAHWLAYVGKHDGDDRVSTLVFVDAPDNLRHPTPWFVRSEPYACICPAPFFHEVYEVADGATLKLRYDIVIADDAWDADRVASVVPNLPTQTG